MKASPLTEGLVFAIDILLMNRDQEAAEYLQKSCCISLADPADRAVVHKMKAEGSIQPATVAFLRKRSLKPTPAARRKTVRA